MKKDGNNRHHIYPKSRYPRIKNHPRNISRVNIDDHALYHLLFKLMNPEEVVRYLNTYFWNNSFDITLKRRW